MPQLTIIERPDPNATSYWDLAKFPAGSMWREPRRDLDNREAWCIVLPNLAGIWCTTDPAGDAGLWDISGEPPNITVTPSINAESPRPDIGSWHGWITNGVMTP